LEELNTMPTEELFEPLLHVNPDPRDALTEGSSTLNVSPRVGMIQDTDVKGQTGVERLDDCIAKSPPKNGFPERFYHWFEKLGGPC